MKDYSLTVRTLSHIFRVGLIALSLSSAALLLTEHTNSISAKLAFQEKQQAEVHARAEQRLQGLNGQREAERTDFLTKQTHEREVLEKQVAALDALITLEMENKVNGEFKGKRYLELQERRNQLSAGLVQMQERQSQELRRYSEERNQFFQRAETSIREDEEREKKAVPLLQDDPNSGNPMVHSFLAALASFIPEHVPTPSQFIFAFAMLLAVLIELGIMVAFENVVVALAPLLRMQLAHGLQQEMLKASLQGEQAMDGIQHEADLEAIRRKAGQTAEKARTWVEEGILKA